MKTKFFILVILFLGIGAFSYAQTKTTAPATDNSTTPAQVVAPEQGKTGECQGHQTTAAKADCKWVDANNDGICDTCKKTEKECKEACKPAEQKSGCPMQKECGKSGASCCPSKDGKK
jgi:hypothetical protein